MFSLFPQVEAQVNATSFGAVVDPIITNIVTPIVELMVSVGIIVFVWGVVELLLHADDPEARKTGRDHMIWGIVGVFIMISAWAIIYVISNTLKGV